jgi:pimeloyl-ACP methyl ester carboxylesterase
VKLRRAPLVAAVGVLASSHALAAGAQRAHADQAISAVGEGPQTFVLISGLVGGVAGYRRLESRLLRHNCRVVIVNPYLLSIHSVEVSFDALARRVDRALDSLGVTEARVVGHGHGGGVAIRLAANSPGRVRALHLLDIGASATNRSPIFNRSVRLVPFVARIPGGRSYIRGRFIRGLSESSGSDAWLDAATQRAYTEPMLDRIDQVIRMAVRLSRAEEPDSLSTVIARLRAPVTVLLGGAPHSAAPTSEELKALEPLGNRLRIHYLPGVGHFPHEEVPDDLVRLLLASTPAILATHIDQ